MDDTTEIPIEQQDLPPGPVYSTPYTVDLFDMTDAAQIKEYTSAVRSLPKAMALIMRDQSTARAINEKIAPQFNLTPDQAKELTRVVRDVLISSLFVGDLVVELSNRLQIDEERGRQIANAVVAQILYPAMEDIKSVQMTYFPDRINQPIVKDNTVDLRTTKL